MAGLLEHTPELMLVTNQWANSYRRIVPGFEAPTHATWSTTNHADLLRVPQHKPGEAAAARIEYRVPDAACNPYLAFAAILEAGLDGVARELPLPDELERPIGELTDEEVTRRGIEALPASLGDAIAAFERSELLPGVLGEHIRDSLVANKRHEWSEFRAQVSEFELRRYLSVL